LTFASIIGNSRSTAETTTLLIGSRETAPASAISYAYSFYMKEIEQRAMERVQLKLGQKQLLCP
jgi:hypothetical protein